MGFGNLGFGEIMGILIIVLLLFGAKRIPEIAGSMGKGIREFKKSINDVQNSVQSDLSAAEERDRLRPREAQPRAEDEAPRPEPKRLMQ
ncbi:MAG TPA: twin-arginine translocase TatA/TatE family subunit [Gemmatimonadaceae bacterium]|jgi:sec-independent protein translocase protein TatA|nr:twin-arginine translocase TatA/TatE family subunit [Gemmatimonadaceae bacterium]